MNEKEERIISVFLTNFFKGAQSEDLADKSKFVQNVIEVMKRNGYSFNYETVLYLWDSLIKTYKDLQEKGDGCGWRYYKFMQMYYDPEIPVFSDGTEFDLDMIEILIEFAAKTLSDIQDNLEIPCAISIQKEIQNKKNVLVSVNEITKQWETIREEFLKQTATPYLKRLNELFIKREYDEYSNYTDTQLCDSFVIKEEYDEPNEHDALLDGVMKEVREVGKVKDALVLEIKELLIENNLLQKETHRLLHILVPMFQETDA